MPRASNPILNSLASPGLFLLLLLCSILPLGCSVGASSGANSAAQQQQAQTATGVVPASFFGMVVRQSGVKPTVPTGTRRLWDPTITWAALEPTRGNFVWGALDTEVAAAQSAGAKITLVLAMTPTWASSQPAAASAWGAGATAMPADIADWSAYVTAVATRYKGQIAAYEVWSAPEDSSEWSGPAATLGSDLASLAQAAAAQIRAADSAAVVVSPVLSPTALEAFLAAGGGGSIDAVAASLDEQGSAPEAIVAALGQLRAATEGAGVAAMPIWNEQTAWVLPEGGLDEATQNAWVARSLLLNTGYGVAHMDWYAWDQTAEGTLLLTTNGTNPTAAANTYTVVEGWLSGAQANGCASTAAGLWTCGLVRDGAIEWVLWSTQGSVQTSALGASTITDINGGLAAVGADGTVTVGASPVLLQ